LFCLRYGNQKEVCFSFYASKESGIKSQGGAGLNRPRPGGRSGVAPGGGFRRSGDRESL